MAASMTAEQLEVRKYPLIHVTVDGSNHFHCLNEVSIRSSIIKTFVMDVLIACMQEIKGSTTAPETDLL
jgi:NAD+ kinase